MTVAGVFELVADLIPAGKADGDLIEAIDGRHIAGPVKKLGAAALDQTFTTLKLITGIPRVTTGGSWLFHFVITNFLIGAACHHLTGVRGTVLWFNIPTKFGLTGLWASIELHVARTGHLADLLRTRFVLFKFLKAIVR